MPGYIGYKPQFNPISLQEYLTVPAMIIEGRQREADKIEQYKNEAEKWRTLMGDSPEAKALWENYDKELNSLGDDIMSNRAGDIARIARRLADTYRGIKYKAEKAETRRERDRELFAKNPDLIGNLGDFMNYYNNDAYTSPYVNGKQLLENVGAFATSYANMLPENRIGYVDPETKHDIIYERGLDQTQKSKLLQDALSNSPTTQEGQALRNALTSSGIDISSPDMLKLASSYIERGLSPLNKTRRTQQNPDWRSKSQILQDESRSIQNRIAREGLPEEWDDVNEYSDTDTTSIRYKYKQKKHASGEIYIERSPLTKKNGKWVQENKNWWQPAPYYMRDGVTYNESIEGTGIYGGNTIIDGSDYQNKAVSYVADEEKGKLSNAAPDSQTVLDDTENYEEIDYNKDKQSRQVATLKNIAKGEGYSEDQLQFRWDKKNKRVIVIVTGIKTPEPTKTQATQIKQQQTQGQTNSDKLVSSTSYEEQK